MLRKAALCALINFHNLEFLFACLIRSFGFQGEADVTISLLSIQKGDSVLDI